MTGEADVPEILRGLAPRERLPASRTRPPHPHPPIPELHFHYDRSVERGLAPVAADRRGGEGRRGPPADEAGGGDTSPARTMTLAPAAEAAARRVRSARPAATQDHPPRSRRRAAARQTAGHELERRAADGTAPAPAAKAGHTGTLDPMASGLLPLTFGEATKFSQMCSTPTRPTRRWCGSAWTPIAATPRARCLATRRWRWIGRARSPCWSASAARSSRCRRCIRRSSATARRSTNTRAPGIELERGRAGRDPCARTARLAGERFGSACIAARAPTSAAWRRHRRRAWLRRPSGGAAAHRDRRLDLSGAVRSRPWRRRARAVAMGCSPGRCAGGGLSGAASARCRGGARPAAGRSSVAGVRSRARRSRSTGRGLPRPGAVAGRRAPGGAPADRHRWADQDASA